MKALRWHGKKDIRCDTVEDPIIEQPGDAILRVSACAICGSDLHLFDGFMPGMKHGDIMGHEFMGEVMETGTAVKTLTKGNRAVVPLPAAMRAARQDMDESTMPTPRTLRCRISSAMSKCCFTTILRSIYDEHFQPQRSH